MFRRKRSAEDFAEEIKAHLELEADELRGEGLERRGSAAERRGANSAACSRRRRDSICKAAGRLSTTVARSALQLALAAQEPRLCSNGDSDDGARRRRQHGRLQRDECGAAAVAAGCDPERLVYLRTSDPPRGTGTIDTNETLSYPVYDALRKQTRRCLVAHRLRAALRQQGGRPHGRSRKKPKATWSAARSSPASA